MSESAFSEAWLRGPADIEFYTRTYTPPTETETKAVIVFVHGFIEHIGRYEHVFSYYAQSGISVFAFDQRGFGRTALDPGPNGVREKARVSRREGYARTSTEQQKGDIFWAINYAGETLADWGKEHKRLPMFLMGHSMGGALVLTFCASPPSPLLYPLAGVIATSPFLAQSRPISKIARKFGGAIGMFSPWTLVSAEIKGESLSHDKNVAEMYMKDPLVKQFGTLRCISSMLDSADHITSQEYKLWPTELPVLLVHGTEDQVTSPEATEKFYTAIKANDKTFTPYQHGFHELHNEPDLKQGLMDEVVTWVVNHMAPSSSNVSVAPEARL